MRASYLQMQLKLNADVLTGLHQEYANLRNSRKGFNAFADEYREKGEDALAKDYNDQASLFTPYIDKFKRKIAKLAAVQKALKEELCAAQSIEAWTKEEDTFWLQQAQIAQEGGYATPDSVDALFVSFPREDV